MKRHHTIFGRRSGQAMIEFCVGLIVLLLLITGILHIGRMARISLSIHAEIRGDAGKRAMQGEFGSTAEAISDWDSGADGLRFTADDKAKINSATAMSIMNAVASGSARRDEDWQEVLDKTQLPFSMARLHQQRGLPALLGFVHRERAVDMQVDPVIRQLVYDAPEVRIKEEIWMPQLGGLY